MVLPLFLPKISVQYWLQLLLLRRPARKLRRQGSSLIRSSTPTTHHHHHHHVSSTCPPVSKCLLEGRGGHTLVSGFRGTVVRSESYFPYFMLLAFEGGGLLRALLLLLMYPLIFLLECCGCDDVSTRVMALVALCGLRRKDVEMVSRAVLPKFYLEDLNRYSYEAVASAGRKVVVTRMPRLMVEGFLRDYLKVDEVVATELHTIGFGGGLFFTGLVASGAGSSERTKALKGLFGETKADVGLVSYCTSTYDNQLFVPHCKETYMVSKETSAAMPRHKYPKPLVFHDGRLAFFPTPSASLFLFLYLPLGIILSIARILLGIILPYNLSKIIIPFLGFKLRVQNPPTTATNGVLYVCNHRTLLDPVMLTGALARSLTAVTYSLSPLSELLSPIKTVRLTRNREIDANTIRNLLKQGDLVVCPEGTTCREPYLLRFSALFAELAEDMEPVAVDAKVSMFYGTTASGFKFLDPVFFMMNPWPEYEVRFLGRVPKEYTCAGGGMKGVDVANRIQKQLGDALGFECTSLTRKDKYLMLAGNDGVVRS